MKKIYVKNTAGNGLIIKQLVVWGWVISYVDNTSLFNGKTGKSITVKNRTSTAL